MGSIKLLVYYNMRGTREGGLMIRFEEVEVPYNIRLFLATTTRYFFHHFLCETLSAMVERKFQHYCSFNDDAKY
jgi:hypothetical protein